MIKVGFQRELYKIVGYPTEIVDEVRRIATILDQVYGDNRNVDEDMGGHIAMVQDENDVKKLNKDMYLYVENTCIPEFVNVINCSNGQAFSSSLVFCNNDTGISILMPIELTHVNLK